MKLKLKHLRSCLNTANISTQTCKDKRDLAELLIRSRGKIFNGVPIRNNNHFSSQPNNSQQQQQQQNSQSNPNSTSFNDRFAGFMNNVQDFVNFNLSSVINNPVPAPPPPQPSASTSSTQNQSTSRPNLNSNSSTNNNTNNNYNGQTTSTSSTSSASSSSSIPNLNSVFNFIGEQIPQVLQQTLNNNMFTFNNVSEPENNPQQQQQPQNAENNGQEARRPSNATSQEQTSNLNSSSANANSGSSTLNDNTSSSHQATANLKRRASLSDLKSEEDAENLNAKQIKEILASNFVEYKGCCEKRELIDKVKRLFRSYQENKRLQKELEEVDSKNKKEEPSTASGGASKRIDETDLCKICMESLIDCVLLDCGHMCSCIKCGKQLGECPICRQYVVKVIRVFKS
jgi:hypothetical protein